MPAAVVVVVEVTVGIVPHTAAADDVVAGSCCDVLTHLSLVSGTQGRCTALCSCLGPSS